MKIPKAWEIKANSVSASAWWDSLSDEHKKEYISEHPDSKYANGQGGSAHESTHTDVSMGKPDPKDPDLTKNSEARKKVCAFLKKKSHSIFSHLKHEAREWKTATLALKHLSRGGTLDDHQKKAVAAVATDIAITTVSLVTMGWAAHGVLAFMHHFGAHMAQEALMKAAIKGSVHVATVLSIGASSESDPDQIVKDAIDIMLNDLETGDLQKYMSSKVESRIDMGADVAGKGLCPECRKPMQVVMAGDSRVWACATDRISIPIENAKV